MAIDYEKDDILVIARYLSKQGFYYSPQWEQAADEIERLREEYSIMAQKRMKTIEDNLKLREALRKIAEWDLTGAAVAALREERMGDEYEACEVAEAYEWELQQKNEQIERLREALRQITTPTYEYLSGEGAANHKIKIALAALGEKE